MEEDKCSSFVKIVEGFSLDHFQKIKIYNLICQKNEYNEEFRFMDGPPFPNSDILHFGHILVGDIKSCVLNYKQMKGYKLKNMIGYDCHGLPIEMVVNKKLDVKTKNDVYKIGIDVYNKECRDSVNQFTGSWEKIYNRIGRFSDYKYYYTTMDPNFMESVWWVFKTLYENKLVYQGFRVMPYSTKCGTPLSNFEAGQNYKDVEDPSIYVKFKLDSEKYPNTSFVVWTTTPWTLPSNLALCVNPELDYTIINMNDSEEKQIICTDCLEEVYSKPKKAKSWNPPYTFVKNIKGSELIGLSYIPPYNYFSVYNQEYKVLGDQFVKSDSGTGIVHLAPAFGEVDYNVCLSAKIISPKNLDKYCPLTDDGQFTSIISDYQGIHIFDANKLIIEELKNKNLVVKYKLHKHSYPFCWRTDTPLIYKAVSSFFINVTTLKDKMIENNRMINWVPESVGKNRFHKWLEGTKDWCVSRSRFFGTPIPTWISDDGSEIVVVGSIDELVDLAHLDKRPTDLHLESISHITIPSKLGKGELKLNGNVFDCWFESGSVPYSQYHYPFESEIKFDDKYLADFVCEGIDQTRGWFYTLLVESTGLFEKIPFKNCICTGLILAEDGQKMSKRLNNFTSPLTIIDQYGSDSLRLYLIGSPASHGESIKLCYSDIKAICQKLYQFYNGFLFTLEHLTKFEKDGYKFDINTFKKSTNIMDHWIISRIGTLCGELTYNMETYTLYKITKLLLNFIEDWITWYIIFNRDRFKGKHCSEDEQHIALGTLTFSLLQFCTLSAPFIPFLSEYIYQQLKPFHKNRLESIHLFDYPNTDDFKFDHKLENKMDTLRKVAGAIRQIRSCTPNSQSIKIPLKKVIIKSKNKIDIENIMELETYFAKEVNAINIEYVYGDDYLHHTVEPVMSILGKKYRKQAQYFKNEIMKLDVNSLINYDADKQDIYINYQDTKYKLNSEDFCIVKNIDFKLSEHQLYKLVDDILIIVDHEHNDEVISLHLVRLFIRAVQDMRKYSKLKPWNRIVIYYKSVESTKINQLNFMDIIASNKKHIEEQLLYEISNIDDYEMDEKIIVEKIVNILDYEVTIRITDLDGTFF